MALPNLQWNRNWLHGSWAETRSIWTPLTVEDDITDRRQWGAALTDSGSISHIVLGEFYQLVTDVFLWTKTDGDKD